MQHLVVIAFNVSKLKSHQHRTRPKEQTWPTERVDGRSSLVLSSDVHLISIGQAGHPVFGQVGLAVPPCCWQGAALCTSGMAPQKGGEQH